MTNIYQGLTINPVRLIGCAFEKEVEIETVRAPEN